jgi:hypothetical protein
MILVAHRINKTAELINLDKSFGVEIDVRGFGTDLILNHEPLESGDRLEDYLKQCHPDRLVVFNIKEAGIEDRVHALASKHGIKNYFLLDVEFPYIYRAARKGVRRIAMRYSEDESIETVLKYKNLVDWVWIDTNTILPLNAEIVQQLSSFKTCLVCPERWGRPQDISSYKQRMHELGFKPTAVMTAAKYRQDWLE